MSLAMRKTMENALGLSKVKLMPNHKAKPLSAEKKKMVKMLAETGRYSLKELALELGITYSQAKKHAGPNAKFHSCKWVSEEVTQSIVKDLLAGDMTGREIARKHGVSDSTVSWRKRELDEQNKKVG